MGNPETPTYNAVEKQERPKTLYHASPNREIDELEPRKKSVRDENEGPVVFATPDKAVATFFLFDSNGRWVASGRHNGVPYVAIREDRTRFMETDTGGTIYELPSEGFTCDPQKGLGVNEWTHKGKIKPTGKTTFPSALDAMIDAGVQVYFVDQETFDRIQADKKEHGLRILMSLKSENEMREKNVRRFEPVGST